MANRIKGITVEIGGDTTGLSKALSGVNKEIRSTQSQLKDVERLLKLDPTNTDLLQQRQRLLAQAVGETKTKLEALKQAESQAQQQFKEGKISQEQYEGLQREIVATENELKRLETQAEQSAVALQKISATGESLQTVGGKVSKVGTKLLPITGTVTTLGVAAVKTAADFDAAMSKVAAVSGATGEDFDKLKAKAREMGSKTKFSASEAAEAMNYMAMAGWETEDMLNGIEGIMHLAAASGEDLAQVSDIVTDSLTAFGLQAQDSAHFADVLAKASTSSNTNVAIMGNTFKYAAPVAGALGYKIEDVAVAVGLMANSSIKGESAGTALRGMLTNLAKPTDQVKGYMDALGISMTTASGEVKPLNQLMGELRGAFANLTDAQKAEYAAGIAGKEAMSGLLAIVKASDEDFASLTEQINNCNGAAEEISGTTQDNLAGQLTTLKSQLEELAISVGEILMPAIRTIVGWIQKFVNKLNGMDERTRNVIVTIALVIAAIAPVLIVIGKVITSVGKIISIVPKMITLFNNVKTAFSVLGSVMRAHPFAIIVTAIAALVTAFIYLWNNCEGFREFWINLWEKIKQVFMTVWDAITGAWEWIKGVFQGFSDWLGSVFEADWTEKFGAFGNVINAFFQNIKNIWNSVKEIFGGIIDFIKNVFTGNWSGAWEGVKRIFSGIWDGLVSIVKAPLNAIIGLINGAIDGINWLADGVNSVSQWVGIPAIPDIPHIPYLAKGGTLSSGAAIVGEAGPELLTMVGGKTRVTPLTNSQKQQAPYLSGGVTVNIDSFVNNDSNKDIKQLTEIIMDEMQQITQRKAAVFR